MDACFKGFLLGTLTFGALAFVVGISGCVGDNATAPSQADSGSDAEAVCGRYCGEIARNCRGADRQYRDQAECVKFCALLTPGSDGDRSVDTVECRLAQAKLAATKEACIIAGPFGGGVCGKRCESLCTVVDGNCKSLGAAAPYTSRSTCIEACPTFRFDPAFGEGPDQPFSGQNTINCREFHAILALDDKSGHCPHTGVTSATCFDTDAGRD